MGNVQLGRSTIAHFEQFWMGDMAGNMKPIPRCWDELFDWTDEASRIFQHYLRIPLSRKNVDSIPFLPVVVDLHFSPYVLKGSEHEVESLASMTYLKRAEFMAENVVVVVSKPGRSPGLLTVGNFVTLHSLLRRYLDLLMLTKSNFPGLHMDYCAICREDKSDMVVLSCDHTLCSACFDRWLPKHLTCPYCRRQFEKKTLCDNQWEFLEYQVKDVLKDMRRIEIRLEKFVRTLDFAMESSKLLTAYEVSKRTMTMREETSVVIVN